MDVTQDDRIILDSADAGDDVDGEAPNTSDAPEPIVNVRAEGPSHRTLAGCQRFWYWVPPAPFSRGMGMIRENPKKMTTVPGAKAVEGMRLARLAART